MENFYTLLARHPPFDGIDPEEVRAALEGASEHPFDTGETALVDDSHRAVEDHPQPQSRSPILDQSDIPRFKAVLPGPLERRLDLLRIDPVERRVARKECVKVLHVGGRNCVRIASVTGYGDMRA